MLDAHARWRRYSLAQGKKSLPIAHPSARIPALRPAGELHHSGRRLSGVKMAQMKMDAKMMEQMAAKQKANTGPPCTSIAR